MYHPERIARLLQIGEAESPGSVLRIDDVTNPECERLAPYYDLITGIYGQRTDPRLPPGVSHVITVVEAIEEMAEACRACAPVRWIAGIGIRVIVCAVERVWRLIDEPFAHEKRIVFIE